MSTSQTTPQQITLELAMANVNAGVQSQVTALNAAKQADYLVLFNDWVTKVIAGQSSELNPPQPPDAYIVGTFTDSTNPKAIWAYPVLGTTPVCAMPALPVINVAPVSVPSATEASVGAKQNVPPGDTMPVGFQATSPSGGVWQKQASLTPFGTAYYYERIK